MEILTQTNIHVILVWLFGNQERSGEMGTYAMYRVWAGVTEEGLDRVFDHPFMREIIDVPTGQAGVRCGGLVFQEICMHGRRVGVGVIVYELDWTTEIDATNLYGPSLAENAAETLDQVRRVFATQKVPLIPQLFHHLDLGG